MQKLAIIVTVGFFAFCLCLPFRSSAEIYQAKSDGSDQQSPRLVIQGDRVSEVRPGEGTQLEFVPGEVLVKFADPANAARLLKSQKSSKGILQMPTSVGLTNVFQKFEIKQAVTPFAFAAASSLKNVVKLTAPSLKENREKTRQLMLELKGKPEIEYAELNFILRTQAVPNDPYYSSSGAWGQTFRDLWGLQNISAETAWNSSTGQNVVVAVSDTGVDYNHEDISANIWQNAGEIGTDSSGHDKKTNGIDDDGNGVIDDWRGYNFVSFNGSSANNDPMDDFGHGTHVAGTIAAIANNDKGIVGVAFGAKIMPVKGLDQNGRGSTDDLVKTILYAADNGAQVINASWGGFANAPIQTLVNAIAYAHDTKGVVFVAAAGNSNADVGTPQTGFSPANIRNVITVSAFDHLDTKALFSNFGQKIDVAAPGGGDTEPLGSIYAPNRSILSLLSSAAQPAMTDSGQLVIGEKYLRQAGTSMAAPHVAGVAALIRSLHPEFSPEQVRQAIRFGADDVGAIGFDTNSGYGRINAARSLTVSMPLVTQLSGPLAPITDTCVVPINGSVGGNGLSTWRLEFGVGTSPVSWTQINSSSTPISNGQLANWNISNLADGTYTLRLIAQNTSGQLFEDRLPITIDNVFVALPAADAFYNPGALVTIKGSVTGCTFASYAIKIRRVSNGQFLANPSVTLTNGGLQRVRNDVLGVWDTTNVPDDRYDIIVEMQQANGSAVQKSIRVLVTSRVSLLKSFDESSVTNPVTSDVDGDGTDEIIFTTTDPSFTVGGKIHVLRQDGTELPGWPVVLTIRPLNNTPAIGDVNGDGIPEIVVEVFGERGLGTFQFVHAFNLEGNLLNGFPVALGFGGFFTNGQTPSPALSDLNLDGKLDIVAVAAGLGAAKRVVAIDGNAKIIFDAALPAAPSGQLEMMVGSIPMVGNIVGDEAPEIIIGVSNLTSSFAKYYALNNKGLILSGWPIQFGPPSGPIMQYGALADLDGDGYDEIALVENRNVENPVLHVLRGNGVEISGFPQTLPASGGLTKFVINPSLADLNGDGWPEIVTVIGNQISNSVVAYDRFGTLIMNSSFSGGVLQTQGAISVASNDADGKPLIVFPYFENAAATQLILQGLKSDGTTPTGFPIYIPRLCQAPFCQRATSVSLLRSVQSTSTRGVIVDASANVFVVDLGVTACGLSGPWPQLQHDARRTGKYEPPIRSFTISASNAFLPSGGGNGNINVTAPNGCGWTASTSASWITITSGAAGTGGGSVNYQVSANGGSERSAAITVAGQTFTVKQAGVPIQVTLQTNPAGRAFTVDGTTYSSSQTFSWTSGASHTITAPSPQIAGTNTQWVWSSWSDGGMLAHTVAPTSNTIYIANFITTPCVPIPSGLMAWWRGDGNARDETGVNHGTLIGNMTFGAGKVGSGFLGNTSNSPGLMQVPDSPSLALNRSLTVEGWLKVDSYGGIVIERRTSDFRWSYQLSILSTGELDFTIWNNNNSGTSANSDPLPLGQFVHFAASLDENTSQARMYINGSQVRQFTITQPRNVISDAIINIGNINGITDELSVYDRALSSSEIQSIHNAGVASMVGKCPGVSFLPAIFTEQGATNRAVALDSVTSVRGPFRVLTDNNFSADHHTRVILFTSDLGMTQPDSTQLIVRAGGVMLAVESVGPVVGVGGMSASYIVVRLPDGLPTGDLPLVISLRGFTSVNSPTLSIAP